MRKSGLLSAYIKNDDVRCEHERNADERMVWSLHHSALSQRHEESPDFLTNDYKQGLEALCFSNSQIPTIEELNMHISQYDWQAVYVVGMVSDRLYREMLASRIFPIARQIRNRRDIEHSAAPDFLHDVFGHLPMFASASYRSLIQAWAQRALMFEDDGCDIGMATAQAALIEALEAVPRCNELVIARRRALRDAQINSPECISRSARANRFYAWIIEYGITTDACRRTRITGAALLSSPKEWDRLKQNKVNISRFSLCTLNQPVDYTVTQENLYSTDMSDNLYSLIDAL